MTIKCNKCGEEFTLGGPPMDHWYFYCNKCGNLILGATVDSSKQSITEEVE